MHYPFSNFSLSLELQYVVALSLSQSQNNVACPALLDALGTTKYGAAGGPTHRLEGTLFPADRIQI